MRHQNIPTSNVAIATYFIIVVSIRSSFHRSSNELGTRTYECEPFIGGFGHDRYPIVSSPWIGGGPPVGLKQSLPRTSWLPPQRYTDLGHSCSFTFRMFR